MVSSAIQTKWLILGDRIHVLRMEKQVQNRYFHSLSIYIYEMLIIYNLIQNSFFKTFWKAERLQKKKKQQDSRIIQKNSSLLHQKGTSIW